MALMCALLSTVGMYVVAERQLNSKIDAAKIGTLAAKNSDLSTYIASQEPNHAHFESIAAMIQREDRQVLGSVLPFVLLATGIFSGFAGWVLSRHFLKPVKESFLSQRRFMQDAAHELRNPLAAMQSLIQQAILGPPSVPRTKKLLHSIDRQANHLSAITTDLLLLERREYPGSEDTDISELLADILEELHYQAQKKDIVFQVKVPKNFVVKIDPQHFIYVAKNLIENAIKFSEPGKQVSIIMRKVGRGWILTVKDRGIGIPEQELQHITQRFYRAENTKHIDGTGLGMAIVAKFARIYKAELDIMSAIGKGTTISVTF